MPEYINLCERTLYLVDASGNRVFIRPHQHIVLDQYFDKYIKSNEFERVSTLSDVTRKKIKYITPVGNQPTVKKVARRRTQRLRTGTKIVKDKRRVNTQNKNKATVVRRKKVVGRTYNTNNNLLYKTTIKDHTYAISNNIGIGILSYNRCASLRRLVDSIIKHTDINNTTIFISDDGSTDADTISYLNDIERLSNIVVIRNNTTLGVGGNSNRLLRCLNRFRYCMLLNDDVEVLRSGWETYYFNIMQSTGYHHFIYKQAGLYNVPDGSVSNVHGINMNVIHERPHGAVLAFTGEMLDICGYFDEGYGRYGREHIDWSLKASEFGLQPAGFWDVVGSDKFFRIHSDKSAIGGKSKFLKEASRRFETRKQSIKHNPSDATRVPSVSYIIPVRDIGRNECIAMVVNNIRAQKFPSIEIIIVEQDDTTSIDLDLMMPAKYHLVKYSESRLFNKSIAFNHGVASASNDILILHDADILVHSDYTSEIATILGTYDACHLGNRVIYVDKESTKIICDTKQMIDNANSDRVVGYFEGGSLACRKSTYWRVGGFCQDFNGYGCEDCDFYMRLSNGCNFCDDRKFDFIHLWHPRVDGWMEHHEVNKRIESNMMKIPVGDRIKIQRQKLIGQGWGKYVEQYYNR